MKVLCLRGWHSWRVHNSDPERPAGYVIAVVITGMTRLGSIWPP
jgi:hypothetical protein